MLDAGIGNITDKDIRQAAEIHGIIFGFDVDCPKKIGVIAKTMNVPVRVHRLLFQLSENLKALENEVELLNGSKYVPEVVGKAVIQEVFNFRGKLS